MAIAAGLQMRFLGAIKVGRLYLSHKIGYTADLGGAQSTATPLIRVINRVDTVGGAGYGIKLPPCDPSRGPVLVINNSATNSTLFTYEASGVNIGTTSTQVAGATGITITAHKTYLFVATEGCWFGGSLAA